MENRFEHTPPEEQQGWGAYATPPQIPGQQKPEEQVTQRPSLPHDLSMCDRVRERLPYLLENADGEISADTVRVLYGHLSICESCSQDFDDHQRIASLLDSMPQVEMPMDFTGIIQRRIQVMAVSTQSDAVVTPVGSRAFGTPIASTQTTMSSSASFTKNSITNRTLTQNATLVSTLNKTTISVSRQIGKLESGLIQRLTAGSILAAIMAFFVSSTWGSEMLGENISTVRTWLDSVGTTLSRIPILGRVMLLVFTALAQVGDLLGDTYRTVGNMAVRGLAMDIGVCIATYYFLVARRQRDASWIGRA